MSSASKHNSVLLKWFAVHKYASCLLCFVPERMPSAVENLTQVAQQSKRWFCSYINALIPKTAGFLKVLKIIVIAEKAFQMGSPWFSCHYLRVVARPHILCFSFFCWTYTTTANYSWFHCYDCWIQDFHGYHIEGTWRKPREGWIIVRRSACSFVVYVYSHHLSFLCFLWLRICSSCTFILCFVPIGGGVRQCEAASNKVERPKNPKGL